MKGRLLKRGFCRILGFMLNLGLCDVVLLVVVVGVVLVVVVVLLVVVKRSWMFLNVTCSCLLKAPWVISLLDLLSLALLLRMLFLCLFLALALKRLRIRLLSLLAGVTLTMTGASVATCRRALTTSWEN